MARPKKTDLSKAVRNSMTGPSKYTGKRGNPDFVSSSFYVPKKVNLRFDQALLTLKMNGYELDRSDILGVLMNRFATAVSSVEVEQGDEEGSALELILEKAGEQSLDDAAVHSIAQEQMKKAIAELQADQQKQVGELQNLLMELGDARSKA